MSTNKTITAITSGRGGAVATIRISGPQAVAIVDCLFYSVKQKRLSEQRGFTLHYGEIRSSKGDKIDDVLVSLFRAPKSYTGEEMVEVSCHASEYICSAILKELIFCGATIAAPGEFTQRAYLNGKMDMVQAEAVADLIAASSESSHRMAMNQMRGGYSREFSVLRDSLLHFTSLMELELDFSEEDVEFADRGHMQQLLSDILTKIKRLTDSFRQGNAIKNGVPTAIIGAPNAGKSTLLNALLKEDRAIVSSIAGTTRDLIEETMNLGGVVFRFIDTAGIRETSDTLEAIGIERTFSTIDRAQIVLCVIDATSDNLEIERLATHSVEGKEWLFIINKCDIATPEQVAATKSVLSAHFSSVQTFEITAYNHESVRQIEQYLSEQYSIRISEESIIINNLRHYELLKQAELSTEAALKAIQTGLPTDLISGDIRETLHHLGTLTGEISTDDILHNIFKNFCIGK